jgi:hypothetical protein
MYLHAATCPSRFLPFFDRWAGIVPLIRFLRMEYTTDLERLICGKLPVNLPSEAPLYSPWTPSTEQLATTHVRSIVNSLHDLASDITQCSSFQSRHNSNLPALNMGNPSGPTWPNAQTPIFDGVAASGFQTPYSENRNESPWTLWTPSPASFGGSNLPGPLQSSPPPVPPRPVMNEPEGFVGGFSLHRSATLPYASGSHLHVRPPVLQPPGMPEPSPLPSPDHAHHTLFRHNTTDHTRCSMPDTIDTTSSTERIAAVISSQMV